MTIPTIDLVIPIMREKKYVVFEGDYDLNIVGLRSIPGIPNRFDDYLCVFYKLQEVWQFHCFHCTTDPGMYWLQHPGVATGTAILQPGQYRSCWTLGLHKGEYEALVQNTYTGFKVWRDRDLDGQPDYSGFTYLDVSGLNCHHAGSWSTQVDRWSAGCQVLQRLSDWEEFIRLCKKQVTAGKGSRFSYTLIEWR